MTMNEIRMMQELWNRDEAERSEAMGPIEDPKPEDGSADDMLSDLIQLFGFEAPTVINFARLVEQDTPIESLKVIYNIISDYPALYL